MWKSSVDIEEIFKNIEGLDLLESIYSLSVFWNNAIYPEHYKADKRWPSLLKLSEDGKTLISQLAGIYDITEEPDFYLALFGTFSYHDLIFDHNSSDIEGIKALLESEIQAEKIRFPYRFGRCLYDRFNDIIQSNRTNHLLYSDTEKLLDGTPKGVYQIGSFIIGPLGVISSTEPRAIYPSLTLPLWHCSDTGCNAIHHVDLIPPTSTLQRMYRAIQQQCHDKFGPPAEWRTELKWLHREGRWANGRKYSTIIETIADCILGHERTELVVQALKGNEKRALRDILAKPPRKKALSEGEPEDVAGRLSPEEQLQLLMVLDDSRLIDYIDDLVSKKIIRIPLGERRIPEFCAKGRGGDEPSEISSLGIRSCSENAIINLSALVWNAYDSEGLINELEWKLRQAGEKSTRESLFKYIRTAGPEATIKELVLSSSIVTKKICEEIKLSLAHVAKNDASCVGKMLWKLGFNPEEFDDQLERLKSRLTDFNKKLFSFSSIDSENDREIIRAVGVNLFVSLEEFLDKFISFNVWLLSGDHFVSNRFHYDIDSARNSVGAVLGRTLDGDDVKVSWSPKGDNALGTLLRYLSKAAFWIGALESEHRDSFKRSQDDLPFYYDDKLRPFPFRHTQLWADSELTELVKFKDGFLSIARLIQQSDLAYVRNGIDHHRSELDFPSVDKMLACVVRLQQAVENSDINRYFPKPFWLLARRGDRYGLVEYTYSDYSSRELKIYGPPVAAGLPNPIYKHPVIIAPGNLLGYPNSQVMFWIKDRSEYSKYWDDYPKKRRITPAENVDLLIENEPVKLES